MSITLTPVVCLSVAMAAGLMVALPKTASHPAGDAERGRAAYAACQGCHAIDENDIGPRHRGVFGRRVASLPDYAYSAALRTKTFTWDAETLDQWLTNPQAVAPGAKMYFSVPDPRTRADLIAFLATQR